MPPLKLFPCTLIACLILGLCASVVSAQNNDSTSRQVSAALDNNVNRMVDAAAANAVTAAEERAPLKALSPLGTARKGAFEQLLSSAIDERLGAHYSWGGTGPNVFDCSGFVWSSFQSAGLKFSRASARSLWGTFAPATKEEEYQFGTLVFFSNLAHVGIVADKNGFYHASRHHGVIYSPFSDYWRARIDGFRRVPVTAPAPPPPTVE